MISQNRLAYLHNMVGLLANGVNPINGEVLYETIFDDPEVIRGLFSVREILQELMTDGAVKIKPREKFVWRNDLPSDKIVQDAPLGMLQFLDKIKAVNNGVAPSPKPIWDKLIEMGILSENTTTTGLKLKLPTEQAANRGITCEDRYSEQRGQYKVVMYDRNGQTFLLDIIKELFAE